MKKNSNNINKINKIDWSHFLNSNAEELCFPKDETKLLNLERTTVIDENKIKKELNFITQSFFICWRALHIGKCLYCYNISSISRI